MKTSTRSQVRLTRSIANIRAGERKAYQEYLAATFLHFRRRPAVRRPAVRRPKRKRSTIKMPIFDDSTSDESVVDYSLFEDQCPLFWMAVNDWGMDPYDAFCHVEAMY